MRKLATFIFLFVALQAIEAHPEGYTPNDSLYKATFQSIKQILEGELLDFKQAVFLTENAYLDGKLDRIWFETNIQMLAILAQEIGRQENLVYGYGDSTNIRRNWGITKLLTESFYLKAKGAKITWHSTQYNFEDPLGEKDWTNTFVSNLILTGKGNCHSLPFLYKILAQEIEAEAYLSLAPSHLYLQIPCRNREKGTYNLELTSKSHPTTGFVMATSYISLETIKSKLYMHKLTLKESIALTLLDLAQGYQKKFPRASEDFILECITTALEYFPNCVNAQLLKVEILAKQYQRIQEQSLLDQLNQTCGWLIENGYDEMPKEMYVDGLTTSNPYTNNQNKYELENGIGQIPYFDAQAPTTGKGRYLEVHTTETLEYIGSVLYNTKTNQVEDIQFYQRVGDLTMNPSLVGRFLSVDPLTSSYPELTPYQFASNTPIQAIDLDGLEAFFIHGTASHPGRWKDKSIAFLKSLTNNETYNSSFAWNAPLTNGLKDREIAALQLAKYVLENRNLDEEITLVGHSHGGNVAILAAKIIYESTGEKVNLITVATPVYEQGKGGKEKAEDPDNPINSRAINDHIHLSNKKDKVSGVWAGKKSRKYSNKTTRQYEINSKEGGHSFVNQALEEVEKLDIKKLSKVPEKKEETPYAEDYEK